MLKVAMIGAGSLSFTRRLVSDLLYVPEFADTEFRFMDSDEEGLRMVAEICRHMIAARGATARIVTTGSQREAVAGADYVLCTVRVGGLEAYRNDIDIPLKYGVGQCVGDTLAPGGISYALRMIPMLLDLAKDIRETAPGAMLLNYSNPMAINTWALRRAGGVHAIGLCHGVQHGHAQLAEVLGLSKEQLDITAVGINHQTWYVQLLHEGKDMIPGLLEAFERHPLFSEQERCRIDVLRRFGYYSTESNGHLSEYLPWYRKTEAAMERWIDKSRWIGGGTAAYLQHYIERKDDYRQMYSDWKAGKLELKPLKRSVEHGSYIIEALETGRTYRGHFNVENRQLVTNLPDGCIVELPCYVDRTGIHATWRGKLPLACAATCRASISVQEMTVEAALTGNRELVRQALLHDPLTAAVCNPEQVWSMADELLEANSRWLPQFNDEGRTWPDLPQPDGLGTKFAVLA